MGPDEYSDKDYEFDGTDGDMEEEHDLDEDSATSPTSETKQDHPAPPGNPVRENRSLEAKIAALRQQLFAMEARAV